MGFEQLLGNRRLKENLRNGIDRGHTSHFYLISGPSGSGKKTLARLLAAAMVCTGSAAPCLQCNHCRKALASTHPDIITVTDPEHVAVSVDIVREMRDDIFIRPNEAEKKVYIFPQKLRIEGENALLKILEEPPSYGVFILLSDNPESLLPTVRSRATELQLLALSESEMLPVLKQQYPDTDPTSLQAVFERSGGYLGQALTLLEQGEAITPQTKGFVEGYGQKQPLTILETLVPMEKWDREKLTKELALWKQLVTQALICRSGINVASEQARALASQRSSVELKEAAQQLQKAMDYVGGNISTAAVCGYLIWVLR